MVVAEAMDVAGAAVVRAPVAEDAILVGSLVVGAAFVVSVVEESMEVVSLVVVL